jgi:hypothetical protein
VDHQVEEPLHLGLEGELLGLLGHAILLWAAFGMVCVSMTFRGRDQARGQPGNLMIPPQM